MSLEQAKRALEYERASLQSQIDQIDLALAALGKMPNDAAKQKPRRQSKPAKRGKTSRANLTQEEALEHHRVEVLTTK